MTISKSILEDHIKNGLVTDIFKMERSYALLRKISEYSQQINISNLVNFGYLFGAIQQSLQTDAILSVARLYDNPNKRYPTRCIKGLLQFLEDNINELPSIQEKYNLGLQLEQIGAPKELIESLDKSDSEFISSLSYYYNKLIDSPEISETINKLKNLRDKSIAHNEMAESVAGPTWEGLENLIQKAKDLTGILGWAFLNIVYVSEGKYFLSSDAEKPSRALDRLLREMYTKI